MPASRQRPTIRSASGWPVVPMCFHWLPNVMVPKPSTLTWTPELPRRRMGISIAALRSNRSFAPHPARAAVGSRRARAADRAHSTIPFEMEAAVRGIGVEAALLEQLDHPDRLREDAGAVLHARAPEH